MNYQTILGTFDFYAEERKAFIDSQARLDESIAQAAAHLERERVRTTRQLGDKHLLKGGSANKWLPKRDL
jgi:hypothetical protein